MYIYTRLIKKGGARFFHFRVPTLSRVGLFLFAVSFPGETLSFGNLVTDQTTVTAPTTIHFVTNLIEILLTLT